MAPQIPKPDGQSQLFEKAVRFPNKIDMKIALGMFAGHKAAIAWTEQGASCERDIRKVPKHQGPPWSGRGLWDEERYSQIL